LRELNERANAKNPCFYSAFDVFEIEKRTKMLTMNPKASKRDMADEIVKFWKALPETNKLKYER
jgi:hypothetical protein